MIFSYSIFSIPISLLLLIPLLIILVGGTITFLIIILISEMMKPQYLREKIDFEIITPEKISKNIVMKKAIDVLEKQGYDKKYLNINGYPTVVLYKEEVIWNPAKDESLNGIGKDRDFHVDLFFFLSEKDHISKQNIIDFSNYSSNYSNINKSGPIKMITTSMSISILFSDNIESGAIEWVKRHLTDRFNFMEVPVIYNLKKNEYYCHGRPEVNKKHRFSCKILEETIGKNRN